MSMASRILDELLPMANGWQPDERGMFVLSVLPDVVVNLIEDPAAMQFHFMTAVGHVRGDDVMVDGGVERADARGRKRVLVAAETGLVTALRTVDAVGIDNASFTAELGDHVAFARVLAAAMESTEAQADDTSPAPFHGVSTWVECEAVAREA